LKTTIRLVLALVAILAPAISIVLAGDRGSALANPSTSGHQVSSTMNAGSSTSGTAGVAQTQLPNGVQLPEGTSYYAAPNGSGSGDGSISRPWDLQTALNQPPSVRPGDIVWLRGGTYFGTFTSRLTGTATTPIIVRQYPGERAVIDKASMDTADNILTVNGAYAWYWGFEITNSNPQRVEPQGCCDTNRGNGVIPQGPNLKFINLVIHDTAQGVGFWNSVDSEVYGCLIYNNGWQTSAGGYGHAIYISSGYNSGYDAKRVVDNILFNQFNYGIHAYEMGDPSHLQNLYFEGNTSSNNGILSTNSTGANLFIGGANPAQNITIQSNYLYNSPSYAVVNMWPGYSGGHVDQDVRVRDNYIVGGSSDGAYYGYEWQNMTVTGNTIYGRGSDTLVRLRPNGVGTSAYQWNNNTYYGGSSTPFGRDYSNNYTFSGWRSATGLDQNSTYTSGQPTGVRVFVRANQYESGRANITVYNWDRQSTVSVDVSGVLGVGDRYEVRNAHNYLAAPIQSGTYSGGSLSLPMNGLSVAVPVGWSAPAATGPEFNVFVLLRTSGSGSASPTPVANTPTAAPPTRTSTRTRTNTPPATWTPGGPTATRTSTPATPPGLSWEAESGTILPPFTVNNGSVSQSIETMDPNLGGRASYRFNITTPGDYVVRSLMSAPAWYSSVFINIDAEPTGVDQQIWDPPGTSGFEQRAAAWRGHNGSETNPEFNPVVWTLAAGQHELIIRGRESSLLMDRISIEPYPPTTPVPTLTFTPTRTRTPTATPTTIASGCQAVTWTSPVNVTVTGNTIQKTGGSSGEWDAGAVSTVAIRSGDGYVQATVDATNTYRMFGLSNGNSGVLPGDIDFAAYLAGSTLMVYERGLNRGSFGTLAVGDVIKVSIESGVVKYYKNGVLFYTSSAPAQYPLLLDTAINSSLGRVSNAFICAPNLGPNATFTPTPASPSCQSVSWMDLVNVTVAGNTVQKTGARPAWDAGAASTMAVQSGNGYVQATVDATNTHRMFGLSNGNAGVLHQDIDFAVYLAGNSLKVYEGSSDRGTFGTVAVGDVIKVAVESGVVKYYKNGALFYTSSRPPTYPLLLDTAIHSRLGRVSNAHICGGSLGNSPPRPPK
jgi:hypothetical protein